MQVFLLLALLFTANTNAKITVPAEWRAEQRGTWLSWPIFTFLPGHPTTDLTMKLLQYITQSEEAYVIVTGAADINECKNHISTFNSDPNVSEKIIETRIFYYNIRHSDIWDRDYLVFGKDESGNLNVVGFDFNEWGMASVSNYFRSVAKSDKRIAEKMSMVRNNKYVDTWITMEPGGLEFNDENGPNKVYGKRLIVSEAVILQSERNPGFTKKQIHDELMEIFDLDEIIWLPKFYFDSSLNMELALPQCPVNSSNVPEECEDPYSEYYTKPAGGGVVGDESVYSGPQLNPQSLEEREQLGKSGHEYDNVLTALTTNGHTDEYVRWVGPNHVLLAYVDDQHPDYNPRAIDSRTKTRLEHLKVLFQQKGINIIPLPMPKEKVYYLGGDSGTYTGYLDMVYTSGEYVDANGNFKSAKGMRVLDIFPPKVTVPVVSARSYMNFVITNQHVLMPKYGDDPRLDQLAYEAVKQAFEVPGNPTGRTRKVVQIINVDAINMGGGGLHCITQQQPL